MYCRMERGGGVMDDFLDVLHLMIMVRPVSSLHLIFFVYFVDVFIVSIECVPKKIGSP